LFNFDLLSNFLRHDVVSEAVVAIVLLGIDKDMLAEISERHCKCRDNPRRYESVKGWNRIGIHAYSHADEVGSVNEQQEEALAERDPFVSHNAREEFVMNLDEESKPVLQKIALRIFLNCETEK